MSLSDSVQLYCSDLRADLERATSEYNELATWITDKRISEDQQRRAEIMLEFGTSDEARALVSLDLLKRFNFCASVRDVEHQRVLDINTQVTLLTGRLHETTDRVEMSQIIAKLYKLAQQVDALPMRD